MLTPEQISQIRSKVNASRNAPTEPMQGGSEGFDKTARFFTNFLEGGRKLGVGALKGAASTITGIGSLSERVGELGTGMKTTQDGTLAEEFIPESYRKPEGTAEKIGFAAEQIAEFLLPGDASLKASKVLHGASTAAKLGRLGIRAGVEALEAGAIRAAQKGKVDEDVRTAALVAAVIPIVGEGLGAAKRSLFKKTGQKIQEVFIKPGPKDYADGFKIENVNKYDVGGSLGETMTKTQNKLNGLNQQLDDALKSSKQQLDLQKVYDQTAKRLVEGKAKQFGNIKATDRVLESLKEELAASVDDAANLKVDLVTATNIKRGAGTKGAWSYGRSEPDSTAVEKVYTTFYQELKKEIERLSSPNVKVINKQISDLIPISNAVIRRIPVAQRNSVIGLSDTIGLYSAIFDPRALALIGAKRLSQSGKFGEFLIKVAEKTSKTSLGRRVFGL